MNRRCYLATLGGVGIAGLSGCATLEDVGEELLGSDEYDVGMSRNAFEPEVYEVPVGESVVWKNTSGADHTVTAYEHAIPDDAVYFATGGYQSESAARDGWAESRGGRLSSRETYEHTFEVTGTYSYVCIPHEGGGMTGILEVTER